MAAKNKKRLDVLVFERGLAESRHRASALIMTGGVLVNDAPVDKLGAMVAEDAIIVSKNGGLPFVSRGGFKIEKALDTLALDVTGFVCLDVGASTGGFT